MSELDRALARGPLRVRAVWTPEPPERAAGRILARRRRRFALTVAGGASVLAASLWLAFVPARESAPVLATQAPRVAPAAPSLPAGTQVELASADARVDVEQQSPLRVIARLRGAARFRVPEGAPLELHTNEVRVRVVSAAFAMRELEGGRAALEVSEGTVEVLWLGGKTLLSPGEQGVFPPPAEVQPPPSEPSLDAAPRRASRVRAADAPRSDTPAQLLDEADRARLSGHPDKAVEPLRKLSTEHPKDRRAPVAAFALGRVLLDDLARPGEAALAFQSVRTRWPKGPLADDATAREAEAFRRAGDLVHAREAARHYQATYAGGRHARAMAKLLAER